ncbi:SDR family oxidoreductase [Granulicella sp. L46]|uniref:SDR family NAD(P)-dependent oxidoreductase n=1 Tax=Granulicella sp. L46 TaxID=1641865 RepID=UPI00131E1850|nr:SDR family oxidoreductase [Granulicella sp. L46]
MKRLNLATLAAAATATAAGIAVASVASAVVATGAAVLVVRAVRNRKLAPVDPNAPRPVVLVTGGSRGLGLAIATRFARNPVRLVLASRNLAELQQAQETLLAQYAHLRPEDFHLVAADLSKPEEAQRLIDEAIDRYGRIDVLVNNAGIIDVGPIESQTLEIFERTMQVNFFAALYTTWAALPHLRKQFPLAGTTRASIVNIASIGGKIAVPHMLPYSAAKFALVGFSEGLHAELRHKGIRVTTVCPGLMRTGGEDHVNIVGDVEFERRWFTFAAKTPGLSVSTKYAANRIFHAVACGRAEITISPQAWLAARFAGAFPETLQYLNAQTNQHILPKAPSELQISTTK